MFNTNRLTVFLAVSLGSLALTASASAAERYASPSGSGSACTAGSPCPLQLAVEAAANGDEVIVTTGSYNESDPLVVPAPNIIVRGATGAARPTIVSSAANAVQLDSYNQTIRDVAIDHSGSNSALFMGYGGLGERVYIRSSGGNACVPGGSGSNNSTLRDSVCWNARTAAGGGHAIGITTGSTAATTVAPTLRNVTAVSVGSSAPAVLVHSASNVTTNVDARNVLAQAPGVDVQGSSNGVGGSISTVTLRTSNFANVAVSGGSSVSSPSSNGNQAADPAFVDAGAGDFRQAPGSPTVDAGSLDDQVGTRDLDRDPRIQGAAVDIGADEIDNDAPVSNLIDGPLGVTEDPTPTFTFTSTDATATFECSLDGAAFGACSGSGTHTTGDLGEGPHSFSVRAVDRAGNRDATPEVREFTVRTGPTSGTDLDPPNVTIHRGPLRRSYNRGAKFGFTSDEAGTTFECVLDSRPVRNCASPTRYRNVRSGRHVFLVFATDAAGNLDSTPAVYRWRIVR